MTSGLSAGRRIIALADTICYLVPGNIMQEMMSLQPLLKNYFMKTFFLDIHQEQSSGQAGCTGMFGEGDSDRLLYLSKIGSLIRREPVTSAPGISIREASRIMWENNISSLIFTGGSGEPLGIMTLRDLRDKVLSQGLDPGLPAEAIMSPATHLVPPQMPAFEALLLMMSQDIHHLMVTGPDGKLLGVVTNSDFMVLQGVSPVSIIKNIEIQDEMQGLAHLYGKKEKIITTLLNGGVSARHITRIITNMDERFTRKIITIASRGEGRDLSARLSWFTFGSSGRAEQAFTDRWSAAIVYEAPPEGVPADEFRDLCRDLALNVNGICRDKGFPEIETGHFLGGFPLAGSIPEWEAFIKKCLESRDPVLAAGAGSFLDSRNVYGSVAALLSLRKSLNGMIRGNRDLLRTLALPALRRNCPLGFYNGTVANRDRTSQKEFHPGEGGIYPIADCIRIISLLRDIDAVSTVERLYILTDREQVSREDSGDILKAFEFLLGLKIRDQLRRREMNMPGGGIDPELLTITEIRALKEVFQITARLQAVTERILQSEGVLTVD